MARFININYPFKDSDKGHFLALNDNDTQAVKADLLHLILTRRGQRLYKPDFGTDLMKFIFEPNDELTMSGIKEEIHNVIKAYFPQLTIDELSIVESEESDHAATLTIRYSITDDVFTTSDMIVVNI